MAKSRKLSYIISKRKITAFYNIFYPVLVISTKGSSVINIFNFSILVILIKVLVRVAA